MAKDFMKMVEDILELNDQEYFQINFSICGYQKYDVLPMFELSVTTAETFPSGESFVYENIRINKATPESIQAARQWLAQKHKELVGTNDNKRAFK